MQEVLGQLTSMERRLAGEVKAALKLYWQNLETILASAVFRSPLVSVHNRQQQLDELGVKLAGSIRKLLVQGRDKLHAGFEQIIKIEPHRLLREKIVDLNDLKNQANGAIKAIINKGQMLLIAQKNRLAGLNPRSVLQRGYSITSSKKTGLLVRNLADVQIADYIITELAGENLIESKVTDKQNRNK
jgi:exodeoxyribonuclease VII large subunit